MRSPSEPMLIIIPLLAAAAMVFQIAVHTIYAPLTVDGGWTAYPAVAMARGGMATENIKTLDELQSIRGVKVQHGYDDRSIRLLPITLWYKWFGHGHLATRIYSILEYLLLAGVMYIFLLRLSQDRKITLLVWSLFLTDTSLVALTADIRPDMLMAVLTIAAFLLFHAALQKGSHGLFLGGILTTSVLALVWPSAAVPVGTLLTYVLSALVLDRGTRVRWQPRSYVFLLAIPPAWFFLRNWVNDLLFGHFPAYDQTWDPEILMLWSKGMTFILQKEITRWKDYFIPNNIVLLIGFVLTLSISAWCILKRKTGTKELRDLCVALIAGAVVLAVFDKDDATFHLMPAIPIMFAILSQVITAHSGWHFIMMRSLGILVVASSLVGLGSGMKMWTLSEAAGYRNSVVEQRLSALFPSRSEDILVVGSAALFPYFSNGHNVTMVDDRLGKRLGQFADGTLARLKFLMLDREYVEYGYEAKFRARWPMVRLSTIEEIGNVSIPYGYLRIVKVNQELLDARTPGGRSPVGASQRDRNAVTPQ